MGRRRAVARNRRGAAHRRLVTLDVDVIALGVGTFPTQYLRFELLRDLYYTARRWHGSERAKRDMLTVAYRSGVGDPAQLFRADRFRDENAFRADVKFHFANHHEAHALDALFFTDWPEALIYTADGLGDNVSYSIRTLQHGKLECHYGGEMMLTESPRRTASHSPMRTPPRRAASARSGTRAS